MRLINTTTGKFEEFDYPHTPPYAILSHTWGDGEITYQDLKSSERAVGKDNGYAKLDNTSRLAKDVGLQFVWIDTCCIDKTSEAELGEAIRSMFNWYKEAAVCYAHLVDISTTDLGPELVAASQSSGSEHDVKMVDDLSRNTSVFASSRWFTRGWTLQELIAPQTVLFYGREWQLLGSKSELRAVLSDVTGIPEKILSGAKKVKTASIAQRMSWVSSRETRRPEDMAYCLLGIFNIQMPLMYGERGEGAFRRLQEEILKVSYDHSIFAWTEPSESDGDAKQKDLESLHSTSLRPLPHERDLLAKSPAWFRHSGDISRAILPRAYGHRDGLRKSFQLDNKGLHLSLPLIRIQQHVTMAVLGCTRNNGQRLILLLRDVSRNGGRFVRIEPHHLIEMSVEDIEHNATFEAIICETIKRSADDSDEEGEHESSDSEQIFTSWDVGGKGSNSEADLTPLADYMDWADDETEKRTERERKKRSSRIASKYADVSMTRYNHSVIDTGRVSTTKSKNKKASHELNFYAEYDANMRAPNFNFTTPRQ